MILFSFGSLIARAEVKCSEAYTLRLSEALSLPLIARGARSSLSRELSQKMIKFMKEAEAHGALENGMGFRKPIEMYGQFSQQKETLYINIPHLYLRDQGQALEIGAAARGFNLQFVAFLQATLSAAQYWVQGHPEVRSIVIDSDELQNARLALVLQRLGFKAIAENGAMQMRLLN